MMKKGFTGIVEKVTIPPIPTIESDDVLEGERLYSIGEYIIQPTFIITSGLIAPSSNIDVYNHDDEKLDPSNIITKTHYIKLIVKKDEKINIKLSGKKYEKIKDEPFIVKEIIDGREVINKEKSILTDIKV